MEDDRRRVEVAFTSFAGIMLGEGGDAEAPKFYPRYVQLISVMLHDMREAHGDTPMT